MAFLSTSVVRAVGALLIFVLVSLQGSTAQQCPQSCVCFGTTMRCVFGNLREIPQARPETTVLDLRFNKIKEIPHGTFANMRNLHTLLLNNNEIKKIATGTFEGLGELRSLYLYKNQIALLETGAFRGLRHLDKLFLHHNILERLPRNIFDDVRKLKRLRLDANNLICNCDTVWLVQLFQSDHFTQAYGNCHSPEELKGRSLLTLNADDLQCKLPHFSLEPRDVDVPFGNTAYFSCQSEGAPDPDITWLHNDDEVDASDNRISILDDGTLMIQETREVDKGIYECIARNTAGEIKSQQAELRYIGNPVQLSLIEVPRDVRTVVGHTVQLSCSASGHPPPQIHWTKNGNMLSTNPRYTLTSTGSLLIVDIQPEDRGQYRCSAANSIQSMSADARIIVHVPPSFRVEPDDQQLVEQADVTFQCEARGSPQPILSWTKDGQPLPNNGRYLISDSGKILQIVRTESSDLGVFTCLAENAAGQRDVSAILRLGAHVVPTFTQQQPNRDVSAGSNVALECLATGSPAPSFRWLRDGVSVVSHGKYSMIGNRLQIVNVAKSEEGIYECIAENVAGAARSSMNLWVKTSNVIFPGDDFVQTSLNEAARNVDAAIHQTRQHLYDRSRTHTVEDLLQLVRYPSQSALNLARAAEVFEQTLETIHEHIKGGHRYNTEGHKLMYTEVVSPAHLALIANMSGCFEHRLLVDCSDMCNHKRFRTIDGSCNNMVNTEWGAANTALKRLLPAEYDNGFSTPRGWDRDRQYNGFSLPSARLVSTTLVSASHITSDPTNTHMLMQWGQFVDHDIDLTPQSVSYSRFSDGTRCNETCENRYPCFPIPVPNNDHRIHGRGCLGVARSSATCQTGTTSLLFNTVAPRQQLNIITSFLDASNVYGSSTEQYLRLRDLTNARGLLRVGNQSPSGKSLLPFDLDHVMHHLECQIEPEKLHVPCFIAGDARANEQLALTAVHTLWVREHNRVAAELLRYNPHWDNHMLFQESRKIIGAMMQHITFTEWLPQFIGPSGMEKLGAYKGYQPAVDPSIANSFATAAYRVGHTLIQPTIFRLNATFQPIEQGNLPLHKAFFAPYRIVEEGGIDPLLRGLFGVAAKQRLPTEMLNTELTERLFELANAIGQDLAAVNIQRGRDHGLPTYNHYREWCGMLRAQAFSDFRLEIPDWSVRNRLRSLYGHVDNVDLFVGGLSEAPLPGSKLGPTFQCLITDQFKRLRDGDRFWYENRDIFTAGQIAQIKMISLSSVICTSSDAIDTIQRNPFVLAEYPSGHVSCEQIPRLDLKLWTHCCDDCSSSGGFNARSSNFRNEVFARSAATLQSPQFRQLGDQPVLSRPSHSDLLSHSASNSLHHFSHNATAVHEEMEEMDNRIDGMEGIIGTLKNEVKKLKRKMKKMNRLMTSHGTRCTDSKGYERKEGSTWKVDECTRCSCQAGHTSCETKQCETSSRRCARPIKLPGQCCPVCQ